MANTRITEEWQEWLHLNKKRGVPIDDIIITAMQNGWNRAEVEDILGEVGGDQVGPYWEHWFNPTLPENAVKYPSKLLQLYTIEDFLSKDECETVIGVIDQVLEPSTVTSNEEGYRTSRTSYWHEYDPELAAYMDKKMSSILNVHPMFSEAIQGVRYDEGEYFKEHVDWFDKQHNQGEFVADYGQRTWTVMIYLNDVEAGGETHFRHIDYSFTPKRGTAVLWNNLNIHGRGNAMATHEALPVTKGTKYIITKWFREQRDPDWGNR